MVKANVPVIWLERGHWPPWAFEFLSTELFKEFWLFQNIFQIESHFNKNYEFRFVYFRILRPGAIWVNLGPLLYHYSDVSGEGSIEPSYEDLLQIIHGCGFEILVSSMLKLDAI